MWCWEGCDSREGSGVKRLYANIYLRGLFTLHVIKTSATIIHSGIWFWSLVRPATRPGRLGPELARWSSSGIR